MLAHNDYEKYGIFNGVAHEESGCSFDLSNPAASFLGTEDAIDSDVERALALSLSRDDADLQKALERSKQETCNPCSRTASSNLNFDQDLEMAIAASMGETASSVFSKAPAASGTDNSSKSFSEDLEKAIKLSINVSKRRPASYGTTGASNCDAAIDLTSSPVSCGKKKRKTDVIEIADNEADTAIYKKASGESKLEHGIDLT